MPQTKTKHILGIDPGFAITGYGIIILSRGEIKMKCCGAITSSAGTPHAKRLEKISQELQKIISQNKPDIAAVEQLFFSSNAKTALKVGEARGVTMLALSQNKLPIREFTPLQIKQALTGYGRADKTQIEKMVVQQLKLKKSPRPDDVTDALAVAITCAFTHTY